MDIVQLFSNRMATELPPAEKLQDSIAHLKTRIAWAAGRGKIDLVARLRVAKAAREEQLRGMEAV